MSKEFPRESSDHLKNWETFKADLKEFPLKMIIATKLPFHLPCKVSLGWNIAM